MRQIKVALCFLDNDENVIVKKSLGADWNVIKLRKFHHLLVKDEVSEVMIEAIKIGITAEVIKEMLVELKEIE